MVSLPVRVKPAAAAPKARVRAAGEGGHLYRQGGNLPFYRRLPFIRGEGFTPPNRVEYTEINLDQLGRFAADAEMTPKSLAEADLIAQT